MSRKYKSNTISALVVSSLLLIEMRATRIPTNANRTQDKPEYSGLSHLLQIYNRSALCRYTRPLL